MVRLNLAHLLCVKSRKEAPPATKEARTVLRTPPVTPEKEVRSDAVLKPSKSELLLAEFRKLMMEFPTNDGLNNSPLHVACKMHYSESFILEEIIAKQSSTVSITNENGDLPLHSATSSTVGCGVDNKVFDALVKVHPEGITTANRYNCLPIHLACHSGGRNVYVVQKLLKSHPSSAKMKCALKLPFDTKALDYVESAVSRPASTLNLEESEEADPANKGFGGTLLNGAFWEVLLNLPRREMSDKEEDSTKPLDPDTESDYSPLHLAVLSGAPPDVIESILESDRTCLDLKTNQGRRAIDCARYAIAGKEYEQTSSAVVEGKDEQEDEAYMKNIDDNPAQNISAAIQILETFDGNKFKSSLLVNAAHLTSKSARNLKRADFDAKKEWRKLGIMIKLAMALKTPESVLGPLVPSDAEESVCPEGYSPPTNLNHVCLEIELPVGFKRLRWAMLNSQSEFLSTEILQGKLNFTDLKVDPWNVHDDHIGKQNLPTDVDPAKFIGAERKCQYVMPKTMVVKANMAYETHSIIDYSDHAFAWKKVTRNPDVPFGKRFECHVQQVYINMGHNRVKMVASVEAKFIGKPPMVAWKIKNAMYNGVTDFFVAKGQTICEFAFLGGDDSDDEKEN